MIAAVRIFVRFQALAARLGVRVDQLFEMDASEVQRRLRS